MPTKMLLKNVVTDTITDIQIFRGEMYVSSFDQTINVYNNNEICNKISHFLPVSKISILDNKMIFADIEGGVSIDGQYLETDCGGIQGLCVYQNSVIAGGWKKKLQVIQSGKIVHEINLDNKVYAMDLNENTLLVGCDSSSYVFIDLRKPETRKIKRVKSPVCSVSLGECAAIGTIKGEIKIDFDLFAEKTNSSYTFNAHRAEKGLERISYPVTSMVVGKTLLSGGSDGRILEFDYNQRKKVREIIHNDIPVSIVKEYEDFIVAGFSDNFEKGELLNHQPEIRILEK